MLAQHRQEKGSCATGGIPHKTWEWPRLSAGHPDGRSRHSPKLIREACWGVVASMAGSHTSVQGIDISLPESLGPKFRNLWIRQPRPVHWGLDLQRCEDICPATIKSNGCRSPLPPKWHGSNHTERCWLQRSAGIGVGDG